MHMVAINVLTGDVNESNIYYNLYQLLPLCDGQFFLFVNYLATTNILDKQHRSVLQHVWQEALGSMSGF